MEFHRASAMRLSRLVVHRKRLRQVTDEFRPALTKRPHARFAVVHLETLLSLEHGSFARQSSSRGASGGVCSPVALRWGLPVEAGPRQQSPELPRLLRGTARASGGQRKDHRPWIVRCRIEDARGRGVSQTSSTTAGRPPARRTRRVSRSPQRCCRVLGSEKTRHGCVSIERVDRELIDLSDSDLAKFDPASPASRMAVALSHVRYPARCVETDHHSVPQGGASGFHVGPNPNLEHSAPKRSSAHAPPRSSSERQRLGRRGTVPDSEPSWSLLLGSTAIPGQQNETQCPLPAVASFGAGSLPEAVHRPKKRRPPVRRLSSIRTMGGPCPPIFVWRVLLRPPTPPRKSVARRSEPESPFRTPACRRAQPGTCT